MTQSNNVYNLAFQTWLHGSDFRKRRERNKRFTFGDQWSEMVRDRAKIVSEEDEARNHGRIPISNNLIGQLVRTIVGRFRASVIDAKQYDDGISERNSLRELDGRMMEEFLISGAAIQKISIDSRGGAEEVWVDNIDPQKFFVNAYRDPRGLDIDFAGELLDLSVPEIIARYGKGRPDTIEAIADLCRRHAEGLSRQPGFFGDENTVLDFHRSDVPGKLRVAEVWTREFNSDLTATQWVCRVFLGRGALLDSFPSPYAHGSHPYAVKLYPLIDGEIHSYVESLVENQRYINRLLSLVDHIMATSAKGALLFPIELLSQEIPIEEVCKRWAQPDSVIPIITANGNGTIPMPQQISPKGGADNAYQLLSTQLRLFEKNSGVSAVLTGDQISGAHGADAYRARMEAAGIVLLDILESFADFRKNRDRKIVHL